MKSAIYLLVCALPLLFACALDDEEPQSFETPDFILPEFYEASEYARGLELPTSLAVPPDGTDRLFINELQSGKIRIVENGLLLPEAFATVPISVSGGFPIDGENGLIGLCFDPKYEQNKYVYVTYTTRSGLDTLGTVARYKDVGNRGDSLTILIDSVRCNYSHAVQNVAFGPDDKLYVSISDGFLYNAPQDDNSLLGKVLRMNRDGSIPDDNPDPNSYVYAKGFRNPYELLFLENGDLITGDIGPVLQDELNVIEPGGNYGWPMIKGYTNNASLKSPFHVWLDGVAPTGMIQYKGEVFKEHQGKIFLCLFGDTYNPQPSNRTKRIVTVEPRGQGENMRAVVEDFLVYNFVGFGNPLDIVEDERGRLFFSDIFRGKVYKLTFK